MHKKSAHFERFMINDDKSFNHWYANLLADAKFLFRDFLHLYDIVIQVFTILSLRRLLFLSNRIATDLYKTTFRGVLLAVQR